MKGLVTVCINSLAENLVFQDGYHARDTHENRARMSRYLVSTLLLLDREVVAKRLRPGVDALVHAFRHDDASFKHTPESERVCQEMTASIKRIQDEEEARIQARVAARSSGQPVASSDLKWERADRNIPTAHWKLEERRAEIERDMRRDLADGDLDLEAGFVIPDNDLVAVENNEEATFVNPNETVDEALDVIEALHEIEPESEPAASSPRGDASRSIENTGLIEDIYLQEMFGTSPAEDEVTLKAAKETFKFEGSDYVLHEMTQESLNKPSKRLWFHHGDLVFFTGLVRGNFTRDFPEVKHDQGLWTSIEKCLAAFNRSRKRHWGVRQVIQMVAEDKKGRLELKGIDITRKEGLNQQYFPVLIRAVQGHNKAIAHNPDTDFALATSYYSTLEKTEANLRGCARIVFGGRAQDPLPSHNTGQLPGNPPGRFGGRIAGQWQDSQLFCHLPSHVRRLQVRGTRKRPHRDQVGHRETPQERLPSLYYEVRRRVVPGLLSSSYHCRHGHPQGRDSLRPPPR